MVSTSSAKDILIQFGNGHSHCQESIILVNNAGEFSAEFECLKNHRNLVETNEEIHECVAT